jgi:hypothetical protein
MRTIPAIAILVLASACAGGVMDPVDNTVLPGDEVEETASVGEQTQDQGTPDARRAMRLARTRR